MTTDDNHDHDHDHDHARVERVDQGGAVGEHQPVRSRKAARAPRDPALSPGQRARLVGHPRQLELPIEETLP